MIEYSTAGSIFDCDAEALVNPVNCKGVAGAGLALEFKRRFPLNVNLYVLHCDLKLMELGKVFFTQAEESHKRIIHFPTKDHWRDKSDLQDIRRGLFNLQSRIKNTISISSVAIPALGCGLGGLSWDDVRPLIEAAANEVPDVRVVIFGPQDA